MDRAKPVGGVGPGVDAHTSLADLDFGQNGVAIDHPGDVLGIQRHIRVGPRKNDDDIAGASDTRRAVAE
ncbi:hypothetical protein [Yoonia sp. SDW83-1]|uniref:hypothetical protein n=1 Tax=Yoonia sp. SDW83-1 TaxID=3366945 RepID=UPI00398C4EC3